MIEPKQFIVVCCDGCNDIMDIDGINAWCDENEALTALKYCHWHIDSAGMVKCPLCKAIEELP